MFEGNKTCNICKKELSEKEKNFGVSLLGLTYIFCDRCIIAKRDNIKKMLHDEKAE